MCLWGALQQEANQEIYQISSNIWGKVGSFPGMKTNQIKPFAAPHKQTFKKYIIQKYDSLVKKSPMYK